MTGVGVHLAARGDGRSGSRAGAGQRHGPRTHGWKRTGVRRSGCARAKGLRALAAVRPRPGDGAGRRGRPVAGGVDGGGRWVGGAAGVPFPGLLSVGRSAGYVGREELLGRLERGQPAGGGREVPGGTAVRGAGSRQDPHGRRGRPRPPSTRARSRCTGAATRRSERPISRSPRRWTGARPRRPAGPGPVPGELRQSSTAARVAAGGAGGAGVVGSAFRGISPLRGRPVLAGRAEPPAAGGVGA